MSIADTLPAATFAGYYEFDFQGTTHKAVTAGWQKNGEDVFEILDADDEFVSNIQKHPFDSIEQTVAKWIETELAYRSI